MVLRVCCPVTFGGNPGLISGGLEVKVAGHASSVLPVQLAVADRVRSLVEVNHSCLVVKLVRTFVRGIFVNLVLAH